MTVETAELADFIEGFALEGLESESLRRIKALTLANFVDIRNERSAPHEVPSVRAWWEDSAVGLSQGRLTLIAA
jgi:ribosomal protein L13E